MTNSAALADEIEQQIPDNRDMITVGFHVSQRPEIVAVLRAAGDAQASGWQPLPTPPVSSATRESLCSDCPPVGYETDRTRCTPCPRRAVSHPSTEGKLEAWIEREYLGYGVAVREKSEAPIPGEPFMSMKEAKDLTRRAVATFTGKAPVMKDYAVISLHEKGFWQIDVYWKMEQPPVEGDVPDHFKTCKIGEGPQVPLRWCNDQYPNAEVLINDEEDDEDEEADDPVGTPPA